MNRYLFILCVIAITVGYKAYGDTKWYTTNFGAGVDVNINENAKVIDALQMLEFQCQYNDKQDRTNCTDMRLLLERSRKEVTDCGFDNELGIYKFSYTKDCK